MRTRNKIFSEAGSGPRLWGGGFAGDPDNGFSIPLLLGDNSPDNASVLTLEYLMNVKGCNYVGRRLQYSMSYNEAGCVTLLFNELTANTGFTVKESGGSTLGTGCQAAIMCKHSTSNYNRTMVLFTSTGIKSLVTGWGGTIIVEGVGSSSATFSVIKFALGT